MARRVAPTYSAPFFRTKGRADIVGFGDAGVYVARSKGDGSFDYLPVPVLADFGYVAGGWRVGRNPRFLADLRGSGRPRSVTSPAPSALYSLPRRISDVTTAGAGDG